MEKLLAAFFLFAIAFIAPATAAETDLSSYPQPGRVIQDIAGMPGEAGDEVIAGRQAGRLLMLANTLAYRYNSSGNYHSLPPAAKAMYETYLKAASEIRDRIQLSPGWREKCGYFSRLLERCFRDNYNHARVEYQHSAEAVRQAAELYFPEAERERFIRLADPHGLRATHEAAGEEKGRQHFLNILSVCCLVFGIFQLVWVAVSAYRMGKYRFHNTNESGVVAYGSFGALLKDRLRAFRTAMTMLSAFLLIGIGLFVRIFI